MNITAAVLPLATSAATQVVRQVGEVVQLGASFARLLAAGTAASPERAAGARQGPEAFQPAAASALRRWQTDRQSLDADTEALHRLLLAQCATQGVDLTEPLVIQVDGDQRLLVDNNHLDRSVIEEMLAAHGELASRLRQLFGRAESLQASPGVDVENSSGPRPMRLVVTQQRASWAAA